MRIKQLKFALPTIIILQFQIALFAFSDGYILGAHHANSAKTYLFDKDLHIVHTWDHTGQESPQNGYACYLLENGHLLRSGVSRNEVSQGAFPKQGTISEIDLNSNVVWTYTLADTSRMLHHDFKIMPNGNILMVAFVHYAKDSAIAAGLDSSLFSRNPSASALFKKQFGFSGNSVEFESIIELQPDRSGAGNHKIVWEWNVVDHMVSRDQALEHPEKIRSDLGPFFMGQWVHLNGMDYNPVNDLIVFTSRVFSEFFIIDHSTTSAEAAGSTGGNFGKGGDLLYRWGRPSNYCRSEITIDTTEIIRRQSYDEDSIVQYDTTYRYDTTWFHANNIVNCLHCPTWIPEGFPGAGNVMFFHNNVDASMSKLGNSQVIEVSPEKDANGHFVLTAATPANPLTPTWVYAPEDMFSQSMSSTIRMPSGNTIIHEAYPGGNMSGNNSTIREVDANGTPVWGPQAIEISDTTLRIDTIYHLNEVIEDNSIVRTDTTIRIDTSITVRQPAFNAAKVMYYPGDYRGVEVLMGKIAADRSRPVCLSHVNIPQIRNAANTLRFSNVSGTTISVYTIQGRLVKKLHPATASLSLNTVRFGTGSYLITISYQKKIITARRISIVR